MKTIGSAQVKIISKAENRRFRHVSDSIMVALSIVLAIGILMFPSEAMSAARDGAIIWYKNVMPALLPFLFITGILSRYAFFPSKGIVNAFMKFLFKINGNGFIAFISGLVGGFPSGAVIACTMLDKKMINRDEAERLLGFTNICSPMFIAGTLAIGMLKMPHLSFALVIANILSSLITGIVLGLISNKQRTTNRWAKKALNKTLARTKGKSYSNGDYDDDNDNDDDNDDDDDDDDDNNINNNNDDDNNNNNKKVSAVLVSSGRTALNAVLNAGCFIIIFSAGSEMLRIALSGLMNLDGGIQPVYLSLIRGILEICNGSCQLSLNIREALGAANVKLALINMAALGFVVGFSGLSVHLQIITAAAGKGLKLTKYYTGKCIQGLLLGGMYTIIGIVYLSSS